MPAQKKVGDRTAFLVAISIIELLFLINLISCQKKKASITASADIVSLIWIFLILWEVATTKLNRMHPVLVPAPEDVFNVFRSQYPLLLKGVAASLQLLLTGVLAGIALGIGLGLPIGWIPRLKQVFYPIANVLTPIPSVVFAPYLIALMPTFRSASVLVIFFGVFWPTLLNTITRVSTIDRRILNSARVLNVSNRTMIFRILLPYIFPEIIRGLKVTLTTSIMLLTFAEMMGATSGMGFFIMNNTHYANYIKVVAGIIVVSIVVTLLNRLVTFLQSVLIKWQ